MFYDCYGAMNIGEDSATIAAALLTGDPFLYEKAIIQPIIAEKIQATIEYYTKLSKGKMDRFYFEKIRMGETIQFDYDN